jgi:hypothetical protein
MAPLWSTTLNAIQMQKIDSIHKYSSSFTIKGDSTSRVNQLKQQFSELTDAELLFERGRENELLTRIQTKLNKTREEVISIIKKVRLERV